MIADHNGHFATLQLGMGSTVHSSRLHERDKVTCNVRTAQKLSVSQYMLEGLQLFNYSVVVMVLIQYIKQVVRVI